MDDNKSGLMIVSMVAIVAVVGLIGIFILISGNNETSMGFNKDTLNHDTIGKAIAGESAAFAITGRVVENTSIPCTDSDGGINYYVKGNTIGFNPQAASGYQNVNVWDVCVKDSEGIFASYEEFQNNLYEYSCRDGYFNSGMTTCQYGCSDGACLSVPAPTCTDSDGGDYPYTFGAVSLQNPTNPQVVPNKDDICYYKPAATHGSSCSGKGCQVMENYCVDIDGDNIKDTYNSRYIDCPYGCSNGACLENTVTYVPFTLAIAETSPSSDVLLGADITQKLYSDNLIATQTGMVKLFSEVNALDLDNRVTLAIYSGSAVIIIGASSPASYTSFAAVISSALTSKSVPVRVMLSSEISSSDLMDLFNIISCTDSDGGLEYYIKGTLIDHNGVVHSDYCTDEPWADFTANLVEFTCPENGIGHVANGYDCPYGCSDGVCLSEPNATTNTTVYAYTEKCGDGIVGMYEECDGYEIRTEGYVEFTLTKSTTNQALTMTIGGKEYSVALMGVNLMGVDIASKYAILTVNGNHGTVALYESKTIGGLYVYIKSMSIPSNLDEATVTFIAKGDRLEECSALRVGDYTFDDGDISCTADCKYDLSECQLDGVYYCDKTTVTMLEDNVYALSSAGIDYRFEVKDISYDASDMSDTEVVLIVESAGQQPTYTLREGDEYTFNGLKFYVKDIFVSTIGIEHYAVSLCFDVKENPIVPPVVEEPSFCGTNNVYLVEDDVYSLTSAGMDYTFGVKSIDYDGEGDEDTEVVFGVETGTIDYTYTLRKGEQKTLNGLTFYVKDIFSDNLGTGGSDTVEVCFDVGEGDVATSNLKDYPRPFINDNGIINTIFIVGRRANVDDVIGVADITASLQRYAGDNPFPVGIVKFDDEVTDEMLFNNNIILVGGMCANTATARLYGYRVGYSDSCASKDTPGVGHIKIIRNKNTNNLVLLVHGYSALDTTMATRVLARWGDYNTLFANSDSLCVMGNLDGMQVRSC